MEFSESVSGPRFSVVPEPAMASVPPFIEMEAESLIALLAETRREPPCRSIELVPPRAF